MSSKLSPSLKPGACVVNFKPPTNVKPSKRRDGFTLTGPSFTCFQFKSFSLIQMIWVRGQRRDVKKTGCCLSRVMKGSGRDDDFNSVVPACQHFPAAVWYARALGNINYSCTTKENIFRPKYNLFMIPYSQSHILCLSLPSTFILRR